MEFKSNTKKLVEKTGGKVSYDEFVSYFQKHQKVFSSWKEPEKLSFSIEEILRILRCFLDLKTRLSFLFLFFSNLANLPSPPVTKIFGVILFFL